MKHYIKILIIAILFFSFSNAFAIAPLIGIPAWAWISSITINAGGAAVLVHRVMRGPAHPSPAPATVSSNGTIKRPSQFIWIDADDFPAGPKTQNVNAEITQDKAREIANKKPYDYPNLKEALLETENPLMMHRGTIAPPVTDVVVEGVGPVHLKTKVYAPSGNYNFGGSVPFRSNVCNDTGCTKYYIKNSALSSDTWSYYEMYVLTFDRYEPPKKDASDIQYAENLSNSKDGGSVYPLYQAEIDKMLQDPDYVPFFSDDTTGLPATYPSNPASASQIDQYNKQVAVSNARESAIASGTGSLETSRNATTTAGNRYQASGGDPSTGVGGDPGLYKDYLDAKAREGQAQADLDKLKAELAADELENTIISSPSAPGAYGDGASHDFSARFSSFMQSMKSSSIFGAPGQVLGSIPGGGQSNFELSFGRFGQTTFDLADYGTAINIIKTLVLAVFSIAGLRIVTLKGGS